MRGRRLLLPGLLVLLLGAGGVVNAAPASARPADTISRSGTSFMLHGKAYRFTGVNAYELATYWSVNAGCGGQLSDAELDSFFGGLRPDSLVRFWAFQALGVNRSAHAIDYTGIDRVFAAAERHGQRLIPVLGSQDGTCDDGHWKDNAWYAGSYDSAFNDDGRGLNVVPYSTWVSNVVQRYKGSPALGMWEPVNEPETADCPAGYTGTACYGHQVCPAGAAATLRGFFDKVGGQIKRLDKNHLVASGVIGTGQCGTRGGEYQDVHASPGIDTGTYHDYGQDTVAVPGDSWNGFAVRVQQTRAVNKPLFTEEVGVLASNNGDAGCVAVPERARLLGNKLDGQLSAGGRGFLPWFYATSMASGCRHDFAPGDPLLSRLHDTPL
ncbi:MAG: mannan endo,4-beta-mannosidase [Actinomycetota bacterium]|jgi:hypothetical protein|nr:mannan endo,4-beta-mannosidase [Actinomycetota bacterium]